MKIVYPADFIERVKTLYPHKKQLHSGMERGDYLLISNLLRKDSEVTLTETERARYLRKPKGKENLAHFDACVEECKALLGELEKLNEARNREGRVR